MKRTVTTLIAAMIMTMSFSSFASSTANPLKNLNSARILSTYVEAITLGNTDFNKHLFADDFEYRNSSNNDKFNKKQYTDFLKANKGLQYNCETTHEIMDESGTACVAKAIMKFEKFTRIDYITLNHCEDGWKVSKVVTTYSK
ncbi:hypothetical protein E2P86_11310 [Sphingobacterium psychroaquaticum]|uniref:nuclear transport factor 2 family protein n=1 Tax=Sphingobacterium psychroaquaticum TaxID=561061 RepID=UPI0010696BAE|nr:nuclear transport factor 2 family protein [Sphingobacterium psychroaquaticum]QBQ41704.1 hypothetical protein E2P86_11310 [Sphingobacterium psychroaquaticum]